jgi:hypothetical protein
VFAKYFYKGLANGWTIRQSFDEAVQEVGRECHKNDLEEDEVQEEDKFLRLPLDGNHDVLIPQPEKGLLKDLSEKKPVGNLRRDLLGHVGRELIACKVYQSLHYEKNEVPSGVVVVVGESKCGKSEVI